MSYVIETLPLPPATGKGKSNPIAATMRRLEVGQSFVVPFDDPAWSIRLLGNENTRGQGHFRLVRETGGNRVYRDR